MNQPSRFLSALERRLGQEAARTDSGPATRPWIGVRFTCAGAYIRVYRNVQGTAYLAGCPKCGKRMRFRVGSGGTDQRFFDVSC